MVGVVWGSCKTTSGRADDDASGDKDNIECGFGGMGRSESVIGKFMGSFFSTHNVSHVKFH